MVKTQDEAIRIMVEKNIIPNTPNIGGQSFRTKYIWTLPVDDLFRANFENLQKLFKAHSADVKKPLDLD